MGRNGTGVRPISGSTVELTFSYKGTRCRERLKLEPTPANLKRAADFLGAVRSAIASGTFDYRTSFPTSKHAAQFDARQGDATLVSIFLEKWVDRQKKVLAASTAEGYASIIRTHLAPRFGKLTLSELKRSHVREWCAEQEFSNKRMSNILSVFRAALDEAVQDEMIDKNVLVGWSYQNNEAPASKDDVDPFTADEQRKIVEGFEPGQERNLFQFLFWTGLRTSELIGLRWQDVDWSRETIRVKRAVTRAARAAGKEETPKTARSTRDVKLLRPALAALTAQKAYTLLLNDSIFHNPRTGKAWHNDQSIRVSWNRSIHKAKVRYRRPYQTRHTYASMMLTAGESTMWVAAQLGHTSVKMIEETYGRWIKDAAPDAGGKAVAMFGGFIENAGTDAVINRHL